MSVAVHVLAWIAYDRRGTDKEVGTSERIATSVNTNAVVIRRTLGQLKTAGLVEGSRGRSGGWQLARDAATITLLDVYRAVGEGEIFALPSAPPDPECYVGYGIHDVLTKTYRDAQRALCEELEKVTVADVLHNALALYITRSGH
ncbi:Rrf2 family protein [Nocardioides luteus]|uniref:Rrf2 family transcriptional regulator n=2 Tax=Nocardioides luteus TaxID=1844 RepID=A0ABQ5T0A4_9ACTN|nr:Rrf2 family transcriptional regulator [Nocardioides luteus]MDR7312336.1 Rrf2 family protein [Nocardioides luteus]GGR57798.1 Rrf2 family transcriptional regulator [Nocardioides luteus]GLJ68581.1 Rrf2 family transcriptional regulator [Nocardioides luteus]